MPHLRQGLQGSQAPAQRSHSTHRHTRKAAGEESKQPYAALVKAAGPRHEGEGGICYHVGCTRRCVEHPAGPAAAGAVVIDTLATRNDQPCVGELHRYVMGCQWWHKLALCGCGALAHLRTHAVAVPPRQQRHSLQRDCCPCKATQLKVIVQVHLLVLPQDGCARYSRFSQLKHYSVSVSARERVN